MPPIVTGSVVALIGLNLASSAVSDAINSKLTLNSGADLPGLIVAAATFLTAALVPLHIEGLPATPAHTRAAWSSAICSRRSWACSTPRACANIRDAALDRAAAVPGTGF